MNDFKYDLCMSPKVAVVERRYASSMTWARGYLTLV